MNSEGQTDYKGPTKGGPLTTLLRPPIVFLCAILLGIAGPYRFSRNPIYLSFIVLVVGLSIWLNDLWLIVTLIPAIAIIAALVIPREERFLEHNFPDQYSSYKATVRRWL